MAKLLREIIGIELLIGEYAISGSIRATSMVYSSRLHLRSKGILNIGNDRKGMRGLSEWPETIQDMLGRVESLTEIHRLKELATAQ